MPATVDIVTVVNETFWKKRLVSPNVFSLHTKLARKKKEDRILTGEKSISCVIQSETRLLAHVASFIKAKQMPINIASELFIPLLFRYEDGQTTTQIGPCGLRRGDLLVR